MLQTLGAADLQVVQPNVQGNRRAALTLAENQGVRRRVRLTVRLGPGVRGSQYR